MAARFPFGEIVESVVGATLSRLDASFSATFRFMPYLKDTAVTTLRTYGHDMTRLVDEWYKQVVEWLRSEAPPDYESDVDQSISVDGYSVTDRSFDDLEGEVVRPSPGRSIRENGIVDHEYAVWDIHETAGERRATLNRHESASSTSPKRKRSDVELCAVSDSKYVGKSREIPCAAGAHIISTLKEIASERDGL